MDVSVGQKAARGLTLTQEHVRIYAEITGEAEVLSVHDSKPVTQLKIAVTRQTGETVPPRRADFSGLISHGAVSSAAVAKNRARSSSFGMCSASRS